MGFNVTREERDSTVRFTVQGDVDLNSTPDLLKLMKGAFRSRTREVIIDLEQVDHMDSSGVAALVEGVRFSKKTGVPFLLARVPASVSGVLELAKLRDFFQYHDA